MIYYVSVNGNDYGDGTKNAPFKTINRAASVAVAGDTVRVFSGTYREWVDPKNGGTSDRNRIIYEAVEGDHPVIKGSEIVTDWENVRDTVWKKTLSNEMFGEWNPFARKVEGDWMLTPFQYYRVHLGDVYINGVSMFEAKSMDDLYDSTPRKTCCQTSWRTEDELILHPELTLYKWLAVVDNDTTTIYCNFREYNPNNELIEINVRPCCFYPKSTGVNYITIRGFEIAQAGCPWTPPTSHQIGMVGPHWSKGWIIENNDLHDAKCSAVSLGKEESTGDNLSSKFKRKTGHRHQLEAVFAALRIGWSKDTIGSHIVRNNVIHDCGQNGIVGHLGCIFSRIEHNHIYNIGVKHEFWGHEIAGIKFHGAVDTLIIGNNIHNCTLGTWLDWQAQGMRITGNIYHSNNRDFMLEVSHGPTLFDNNLFMSQYSLDYWAQGSAFVHNLFCGKIKNIQVMDRNTPYHYPHSTEIAGFSEIFSGDDRYYNNVFIGKWSDDSENLAQFTKNCDKFTSSEVYEQQISDLFANKGYGDYSASVPQAVWINGNAYSGNASPSVHEKNPLVVNGITAEIEENDREYILTINVPEEIEKAVCEPVTTRRLGETRISAMPFEAPDGSDYNFTSDIIGESRKKTVLPGPFAMLRVGQQSICVWKK